MPNDTHSRSKEAYDKVMNSGLVSKRASDVYDYHYRYGRMGKREMFQRYHAEHPGSRVQVDSFSPRYAELVRNGLMHLAGEGICPYTNMTVTKWDVTTLVPVRWIKAEPKPGSKKHLEAKIEYLVLENAHLRRKVMSLEKEIHSKTNGNKKEEQFCLTP